MEEPKIAETLFIVRFQDGQSVTWCISPSGIADVSVVTQPSAKHVRAALEVILSLGFKPNNSSFTNSYGGTTWLEDLL